MKRKPNAPVRSDVLDARRKLEALRAAREAAPPPLPPSPVEPEPPCEEECLERTPAVVVEWAEPPVADTLGVTDEVVDVVTVADPVPFVAPVVQPQPPVVHRSITPILVAPVAPAPVAPSTTDPVDLERLAQAEAAFAEWAKTETGRKLLTVQTIPPGRLWVVLEARVRGAFLAGFRAEGGGL